MRFDYLFATLAAAATSFAAAVPVASTDGANSARSTLGGLSDLDYQLGPLADKFASLAQSGPQHADLGEVTSVVSQISTVMETGVAYMSGLTTYGEAEDTPPVFSFVKHTEIITSNAEVFAYYGPTADLVRDLINQLTRTMNCLMAVIDPRSKEALSSDFAIINGVSEKFGSVSPQ